MELWHYNQIKNGNRHLQERAFVIALRKAGVPISRIDTNAWEHNLNPSVIVNKKEGQGKFKIYRRFSKFDLKNALKFYRSAK